MDSQSLALVAVIGALRQSGILDRQAVKSIDDMLLSFAERTRALDPTRADQLVALAKIIELGPLRSSCLGSGIERLLQQSSLSSQREH